MNPTRLTKTPRSSFEDEYVHAIRTLTAGVDRGRVKLLVATGQYVPLMQELDWVAFVEELNAAAERTMLRELTRTAQAALDEGVRLGNELGLVFDATNPQVQAWAQRHAAELVTAVSRQVRNALSAAVLEASAGIAPARLAPLLLDTGIGLTRPWMQAVLTRAEQLGVGASDPRVRAYSQQLMRARGRMIARTEVMRAQNAGRMAGWRQAMDAGMLDRKALKRWLASPRPCPQCQGLAGETVPFGQPFSTGQDAPPAHPHCVCTVVIDIPIIRKAVITKRIVRRGGRWCVVAETTGRNFGCYPSREAAARRLRQIERFG